MSGSALVDCIGNTPLIRVNSLSDETGCEILGKAEFMNPGGSVKDRAALGIVLSARESGALKPGGVIVEGTAGNTGIGLAMVGSALGHRTVIVMPDNQSAEKIDTLKAFGAEVRLIPAVPYKNPDHFVHTSGRLAEELNASEPNGAFWANQFENLDNRAFHEKTTGPEIWEQTDGKVDGFICAVGTGGTLGGVGRALKELNPDITIGLSDPGGSGLHNYFANGEVKIEGSSISEGIGNSRVTANLEGSPVDISWQIPDDEAVPLVYDLIRHEGLVLGGSSGINLIGATRLARELGPGHTIVTILCDSALRYKARLFNREYLASKGLSLPDWWAG
ncbi:MAG: cysteine synthase A [Woeseiaceae bacterium]|nr:cysteine synthase A [Woeseiaceae bacterium]